MDVQHPPVWVEDENGNLFEAYRIRHPDGRVVHLDKLVVDLYAKPYREVEYRRKTA